jgi:hypothetical protein
MGLCEWMDVSNAKIEMGEGGKGSIRKHDGNHDLQGWQGSQLMIRIRRSSHMASPWTRSNLVTLTV